MSFSFQKRDLFVDIKNILDFQDLDNEEQDKSVEQMIPTSKMST